MSLLSAVSDAMEIAAFRGVTFHMISREQPVGRRVVKFQFPGLDTPKFADLGRGQEPLRVEGWLLGDDYVRRGRRMEQALQQPGPGTLLDPWRGELKVIPVSYAPVSYNHQERGWAKFNATFEIVPEDDAGGGILATLARLIDAVDDLLDEARLLAAAVLSPLALPLAALGFVQGLMGYVGAAYDVLFAGAGASAVSAAAADARTDLGRVGAVSLDANYGAAIADVLAALPAAVSDATAPADLPAIGPGELAPNNGGDSVDPVVAAALLLAASVRLAGLAPAGAGAPGPFMAALLPLAPAAEAVRAATLIPFSSSDEASSWRDRLDAQLAHVEGALSALMSGTAVVPMGSAAATWRAARACRAALAADMHATIGRLPAVRTITTPAVLNAWTIALHVAGDTPSAVVPALLDLVRRNRPLAGGQLRNPGAVPPGVLELLA